MSEWYKEPPGGGSTSYDWGTPSPSKDFAPLKEQSDFVAKSSDTLEDDGDSCRNCGQPGHFARSCPEPRQGGGGACFNCGENGHNKVDCPHPRVFKGACHICSEEGHPAAECPQKPADVCKNCRKEGHKTSDCQGNRQFDLNDVPDETPDQAWANLKKADAERDLGDFRAAFQVYTKADPTKTFVDIETKLRAENANVYLIALEKQKVGFETFTLIDLQGKLDCTYAVKFFFGPDPRRATLTKRWPATKEENIGRLVDAGFEYDRMIPKCHNCGEMGHISKSCKQERAAPDRVEVKCVNCAEVGHRARDCTKERTSKFACRNCGSSAHKAADCTAPPNLDNVECRRCNEKGHFAKDCPSASNFVKTCRKCGAEDHLARDCDQARSMDLVMCNDCDKIGRSSCDCPEPKDWSRAKCSNWGEKGHTMKRCPRPAEDPSENAAGTEKTPLRPVQPVEATGGWITGGQAPDDAGG